MSKKELRSINKNLQKQSGIYNSLRAYIKELDSIVHSLDVADYLAKRAIPYVDRGDTLRTLTTVRNDIISILSDAECIGEDTLNKLMDLKKKKAVLEKEES